MPAYAATTPVRVFSLAILIEGYNLLSQAFETRPSNQRVLVAFRTNLNDNVQGLRLGSLYWVESTSPITPTAESFFNLLQPVWLPNIACDTRVLFSGTLYRGVVFQCFASGAGLDANASVVYL